MSETSHSGLSQAQIAHFIEHGYVGLEGAFDGGLPHKGGTSFGVPWASVELGRHRPFARIGTLHWSKRSRITAWATFLGSSAGIITRSSGRP